MFSTSFYIFYVYSFQNSSYIIYFDRMLHYIDCTAVTSSCSHCTIRVYSGNSSVLRHSVQEPPPFSGRTWQGMTRGKDEEKIKTKWKKKWRKKKKELHANSLDQNSVTQNSVYCFIHKQECIIRTSLRYKAKNKMYYQELR